MDTVTRAGSGACTAEHVHVNGRVLRQRLKATGDIARLDRTPSTHWIEACPVCDATRLDAGTNTPLPFARADGGMRTCDDLPSHINRSNGVRMFDFCGIHFSATVLRSSYSFIVIEDTINGNATDTCAVEHPGRSYLAEPCAANALAFSQTVCAWGGGYRVWGNLQRFHHAQLGERLHGWLRTTPEAPDDESAIAPASASSGVRAIVGIKGLGISFASKHLRMLLPQRFAVLDDVLSRGLGFALNTKGYGLFMRELRHLIATLPPDVSSDTPPAVAQVESGIFGLVRQKVRSRYT